MKYSNALGGWKYKKQIADSLNKWLLLGDSVTMGIGIDNDSTFAGIMDKSFREVNMINMSMIGYSARDYYNVFHSLVVQNTKHLSFDKVLLFWTLNDIYSNFPSTPALSSKNILFPLIKFLRENSNAYHFFSNTFADRPKAYYKFDEQFYA